MSMLYSSSPAQALSGALQPAGLPSFEVGDQTFFTHRAETLVMRACWVRGIGFDLFATRFNVPRLTLLQILRGEEPVPAHTRRILEDFVARTLGRGPGAIACMTTAGSASAATDTARL